jgi:inorganic pyrophosphatase
MRDRATIFIIDKNGKDGCGTILLIHRLKDGKEYYVVPGGGIEPDETGAQAAVREAKEETGLDVILGEKIGENKTAEGCEYFYIAKSWSGTPALGGPEAQRQSPTNNYKLEWMPIEKLDDINLRKETQEILMKHLSPASRFINSVITITIDRPLGSKHPKWDFEYPVNYGFVPDTKSGDGEEIDAYILGVNEPLKKLTGKCIAVIHRLNDNDDKLILAPNDASFTDVEIRAATEFQEKFFKSVIVR